MSEWLVAAIILAGNTVITAGVGAIVKKIIERKIDKKDEEQKEIEILRAKEKREERRKDVLEIVQTELQPINEKIDNISKTTEQCVEGTVTILREEMKQTRDQMIAQEYKSSSDDASWHELYNTYKKLGGNHFAEYVDAWKADVENLPRK